MGCDIHFYVEVKDENGNWHMAGKPTINPYPEEDQEEDSEKENSKEEEDYFIPRILKEKLPEKIENISFESGGKFRREIFYHHRNYALFGILSGVRWRSIKKPIARSGVPVNASDEYKKIVKKYGSDGHSHGYATVKDLISFDWTSTTKTNFIINLSEYLNWSNFMRSYGELPPTNSYLETYDDPEKLAENHVSEEQALKLLNNFRDQALNSDAEHKPTFFHDLVESYGKNEEFENDPNNKNAAWKPTWGYDKFVFVQYDKPLYALVEEFWHNTMPRLLALGDPENVRAVFFYDN